MSKLKVRIKKGSKGKPLGERVAELKAKEGEKGEELYRTKAKLNVHFKNE